MIVNLFSVPIMIGNIDLKKVKLKNEGFSNKWLSQTKTSHGFKNVFEPGSEKYVGNLFADSLGELIKRSFMLRFTAVWENNYMKNDFQEPHIHVHSHFSFIIYKKANESNTVFLNPSKYLLQSLDLGNIIPENYKLSLRQGQFVIFPSFLEHMVLQGNNYTTVSGNFNIKEKI